MILDSILDRWTNTITYFWRDAALGRITSPYFDTEDQAQEWLCEQLIDVDNSKK
jgi:hypothetical protein